VLWLWIAIGLMGVVALALLAFHVYIITNYIPHLVRAFQEKPLFIPPSGQPTPDAENVDLKTTHDLVLKGCYFKARGPHTPRKGVILFGLEFGSNRWACLPYCDFLRDEGYDIFAFEMRGQGNSPAQPGYEPIQWVTEFEVDDFRTAIHYLKSRPDADPRGIGFFGISKGGSAGLTVAAEEPWLRCFVTDGMFGTMTTLVPYMQRFIHIYTPRAWVANILPRWYYVYAARYGLKKIRRQRHCSFPAVEKALPRIAPRPLLMIHGAGDRYITPAMAQALFERARSPKEFWLVAKAKHNQALEIAGDEYRRRILAFFNTHLANENVAANGPAKPAEPETPSPAPMTLAS